MDAPLELFSVTGTASVFEHYGHAKTMKKTGKAIAAYARVGEQNIVSTSSPQKLMAMLFDKSCTMLRTAVQAFEVGDDQAFHQAALHALQIVLSLRYVLDTDSGSELSESLFATYTTIAASLKRANQEKDIEAIATIYEALDELRTAWHSVI